MKTKIEIHSENGQFVTIEPCESYKLRKVQVFGGSSANQPVKFDIQISTSGKVLQFMYKDLGDAKSKAEYGTAQLIKEANAILKNLNIFGENFQLAPVYEI